MGDSGTLWGKVGVRPVFMGEHHHSLDDKGRLILPAKFRTALGDRFIATKGLDRCLFVYPLSEWSILEQKLKNLPFTQGDYRTFARLFFSGAAECEFDKQGRVLIPQSLREYAGIEKDVAVIGVSTRVEIWSKPEWEKYQDESYASYEALAEKIVDLGNETK